MHYLLFNNSVLFSDGVNVRRLNKNDLAQALAGIEKANLCVVDVDMLISSAVEVPVEKKDSILVRKFTELYQHDAYIIQDEKIDHHLFQIMGIKEEKVREIYSFIHPSKVGSFIPYGMALRQALSDHKVDLNRTIVFVDGQEDEHLVTVLDGLKFSRTRIMAGNEDILPEIKRSHIDFFKKNEENFSRGHAGFTIVVNNQLLASEILAKEDKLPVEFLNMVYPALEGLKNLQSPIKYRLPEEIRHEIREADLKNKTRAMLLSLGICLLGACFFLFNKIEYGIFHYKYHLALQANQRLNEELTALDRQTYRQDLQIQKSINYGASYLAVLDQIPAAYEVNSFTFTKSSNWSLEMSLLADADATFDPIPATGILKYAQIKDIFVNNQAGKHLKIRL